MDWCHDTATHKLEGLKELLEGVSYDREWVDRQIFPLCQVRRQAVAGRHPVRPLGRTTHPLRRMTIRWRCVLPRPPLSSLPTEERGGGRPPLSSKPTPSYRRPSPHPYQAPSRDLATQPFFMLNIPVGTEPTSLEVALACSVFEEKVVGRRECNCPHGFHAKHQQLRLARSPTYLILRLLRFDNRSVRGLCLG